MNKRILFITLLCGATVAPVSAWQVPGNNSGLVLEVMARRYSADGMLQGTAGDHGSGEFQGFVYATSAGSCGLGASDTAPTSAPAVGWRFTGRVLGTTQGATGQQLMVRIEWERMWDNGAALTSGPRGTHTLNIGPGNSVVLDRVTAAGTGSCKANEARLEASVVSRSAPGSMRYGVAGGVPGGVQGGVGASAFAGRGVGRGGASPATTVGVQGGVAGGVTTDVTTATGRGVGAGGRGANATTTVGVQGGVASTTTDVTTASGRGMGVGRGGRSSATVSGSVPGSVTGGVPGGVASTTMTAPQGRGGRGRGTADMTAPAAAGAPGGVAAGAQSGTAATAVGAGRGGRLGGRGVASTAVTAGAQGTAPGAQAAGVSTSIGRGGRASTAGIGPSSMSARADVPALTGGRGSAAIYESEIWLVHQQGRGAEQVQQQTIRFGSSGADYSFPPISISTSRGIVTLDISGRLQVKDPSADTIEVTIARRARAAGSPPLDTMGWTRNAIQIEKPGEVLSFEFPALPKAAEDLLGGHKFSLRLRLAK